MSLFNELKRRNVFRVAIAYIVMAWLVMQVADVILNNIEAPGWVFQVILLLLLIGFLFALFFAWAFEMTPEGLKREHEVDRSQSITPQTGQKLNKLIFTAMAMALAYFAYDKFVLGVSRDQALVESTMQSIASEEALQEGADEQDKSIAVLPFVNMSDDASNEFFSDGLSEELLNLLAKIPELRVIARTSSFAYKGTTAKISEVARELNVDHVLEGSVRKAGNQVRVTAQLIRANDSSHLWSETYDRSLDDIFAIQDEIATEVVNQLKVTLLGAAPEIRNIDPDAYALFLQGRHMAQQRTPEAWQNAIPILQQALEIEPEYVPALIELGGIYQSQAGRGLRDYDEGLRLAYEAVNRAVELEPQHAPAHALLGWLAMYFDRDLAAAARHLDRALELDSGDTTNLNQAATLLHNLGRTEETITIQRFIIERDPVNTRSLGNLALALNSAGHPEEAMEAARRQLRLNPGDIGSYTSIALSQLMTGDPQGALAAANKEVFEPYRLIALTMVYHELGRHDESDAALAELIEKHEQGWAYNIAYCLAYRGENDRAFEWLDKAVLYNDAGLAEIPTETAFANIEDDPRWLPFLERLGKSPEQLAAIEFEVKLPE